MLKTVFQSNLLKRLSLVVGLLVTTIILAHGHAKANKSQTNTQIKNCAVSATQVAHWLNWIAKPGASCACRGYYHIAPALLAYPHPRPAGQQATTVTSRGPSLLKNNGVSVLRDHVVVTQRGRVAKSDIAFIHYDHAQSKIKTIRMKGHVRLAQADRLVVGKTGLLDLKNSHYQVHRGWYRFHQQSKQGKVNYWGRASQFDQFKNGNMVVRDGSISSCPPLSPFWQLSATRFTYYHQQHRVAGVNGVLRVKGVPVFYMPYFAFPVGDFRRSGWLMPQFGYQSLTGMGFGVPYYWNLAPNYDLLLTPTWWTKRGLLLQSNFRYLTLSSKGELSLSGVWDHGMAQERQSLLPQAVSLGGAYVNTLNRIGSSRGGINFNDQTNFNSNLNLNINLNLISDPYFNHDFGLRAIGLQNNQLLNQVTLGYRLSYGSVSAMLQGFQTLHQVNQAYVSDQYRRLPEIDYTADFSHVLFGGDLGWDSQFVNFNYVSQYAPDETFTKSQGLRWHARPRLAYDWDWHNVDVRPTVFLDALGYSAQLPAPAAGASRPQSTASRVIPMVTLGLKEAWQRSLVLGRDHYWMTLVPRVRYEYVPYEDQSHLPVFDTSIIPFSYSQVFALNTFSGLDRLQNTSQISLGLESQLLRQTDGLALLSAGVGAVNYLAPGRVCLQAGCQPQPVGWSPIAGNLTYSPGGPWSSSLNAVWQPGFGVTTMGATLNYELTTNQRFALSLNQVKTIEKQSTGKYSLLSDAQLLSFGTMWPIGSQWGGFGYINYNIAEKRPESYFFGIQYDSCCWTVRVLAQRYYTGFNALTQQSQYGNGYSIQFLFKGLGGLSSGSASSLMAAAFPGFQDPFKST